MNFNIGTTVKNEQGKGFVAAITISYVQLVEIQIVWEDGRKEVAPEYLVDYWADFAKRCQVEPISAEAACAMLAKAEASATPISRDTVNSIDLAHIAGIEDGQAVAVKLAEAFAHIPDIGALLYLAIDFEELLDLTNQLNEAQQPDAEEVFAEGFTDESVMNAYWQALNRPLRLRFLAYVQNAIRKLAAEA